jgi:hypothetical protein
VKPDLDPVTLTVRVFAASDAVGLKVAALPPVIATPERYHWYRSVTGAGPHVPGLAVRVDPTLAVPVMMGVALISDPLATAAVGADVLEKVVNPVFEPVTLTVRIAPRSSATGV